MTDIQAIRMIKDMGLHLQKKHDTMLTNLEPDDFEALKRLYLSAYAWDKLVFPPCIGTTIMTNGLASDL